MRPPNTSTLLELPHFSVTMTQEKMEMNRSIFNHPNSVFYLFFFLAILVLASCETRVYSASEEKKLLQLVTDSFSFYDRDTLMTLINRSSKPLQDTLYYKLLENYNRVSDLENISYVGQALLRDHPESPVINCLAHYNLATYFQYQGQFDTAENHYNKAVQTISSIKDTAFHLNLLLRRGGNFSATGRYEKAVEVFLEEIELAKAYRVPKFENKGRIFLANALQLKGDYQAAINFLEESLLFAKESDDLQAIAYIEKTLGNTFQSLDQPEEALIHYQEALRIRNVLGNPPYTDEYLFHYSRVLVSLGKYKEAKDSLLKVEILLRKNNNQQGLPFVLATLGEVLEKEGNLEKAIEYQQKSKKISAERGQLNGVLGALNFLEKLYSRQQNAVELIETLRQKNELQDSLFNLEKEKITKELIIKYETTQKEQKIKALQVQKKLANQRNWWIGSTISVFALATLILFRVEMARKNQKLRAEKELADGKARIFSQQLELKEQDLQSKKDKLNDFASILMTKNEEIRELIHQVEKLKGQNQEEIAEKIDRLHTLQINTSEDQAKFFAYFENVYPGYIARQKEKYTDITSGELHLILMAKMGLSLKEQASIRCVSVSAIKKGRYRLKTKYNINLHGA